MDDYISVSEMAKLHRLSRQSLIHYDNIALFKPIKTNPKGYRFYSKYQIPHLREICFLRSMGIGLEAIVSHFQERCPAKEIQLLQYQKQVINSQIAQLVKVREYLTQRVEIYEEALDGEETQMHDPFIRSLHSRQAIFTEWIQPINKANLHTTLMSLWQKLFAAEMIASAGLGSIVKEKAVGTVNWLRGAGSCIFLPRQKLCEIDGVIQIPAGDYACMYKYGMPYDVAYVEQLMNWINNNGYELCGDIIDACLLDTTFYNRKNGVDFCMLQAPVRKKKKLLTVQSLYILPYDM